MAQSIEYLTLGFGSDHDLRVMGWSLALGSPLSRESASPSPFPSTLPSTHVHFLSLMLALSLSNK